LFSKKIGFINTFAILSFISIIVISIASGVIYFSFLQKNLLQREITISSEFIRSISLINNPQAYFEGTATKQSKQEMEEFYNYIANIPAVFRVVIYNRQHQVIWSNHGKMIGKVFPDNDELTRTYQGENIVTQITVNDSIKKEHHYLPENMEQFIEGYLPVWSSDKTRIVGAVELYKSPQALFNAIKRGRLLVIGVSLLGGLIQFIILYSIVRIAHRMIEYQRIHINQANRRAVELNEHHLRRIGSELHDGPAQSIGFALLKFDAVTELIPPSTTHNIDTVNKIEFALKDALQEIRDLSAGLIIPDLNDLCATTALEKVIQRHEKRTSTTVKYNVSLLPRSLSISTKICLYRFIQEGLNNAFYHGKGINQFVSLKQTSNHLIISVSDDGPGIINMKHISNHQTDHLGLRGLRERVESLGGTFKIKNKHYPSGVQLIAVLPIS
jgi:signal transduction histidine kinase